MAFVIDDLVSVQPWQVRGIEIRGRAEALTGLSTEQAQFGAELIRIYPERILSWGPDPAEPRDARAHRQAASLLRLARLRGWRREIVFASQSAR